MTQNWHVKLGAEQTHIPKRDPVMTCQLQAHALMCFQNGQQRSQHPTHALPLAPSMNRTAAPVPAASAQVLPPQEEDAMGWCRVGHHCCHSCPRIPSQHSVPHSMPSSLLNIPLCCTISREIMGQPSVFPGRRNKPGKLPRESKASEQ